MIQITRTLARQLRTVLRKASAVRGPKTILEFQSHQGELCIRAQLADVFVEYRQADPSHEEGFHLPCEALEDFHGRKDLPVSLERLSKNTVQASWVEGAIPRVKTYQVPEAAKPPSFPGTPAKMQAFDRSFLKALEEASQVAGDNVRYATDKIQLRGSKGSITGTDGRQVLVQSGFNFPWTEDFLIPALDLFGCHELPEDETILVGKGDKHLTIQIGSWLFHLVIDQTSRFPDVGRVIPSASTKATTWRLSTEDATFLSGNLSRLPGQEGASLPITLDLNGHAALRVKGENQPQATEIILNGSEIQGSPVRLSSAREYLSRAVSLGFTEFHITSPDTPIVCRAPNRLYVWAPLPKVGILEPSDNAIRIESTKDTQPKPPEERKKISMNHNHALTATPTEGAAIRQVKPDRESSGNIGALITEAQALKEVMRDVFKRSSRLVACLKRHRKQSKIVTTTLASLRQLQQIQS